jgi:hypothetical protein
LATFAVLSLAAATAARAQHLDQNLGVVRAHPAIHNVYMTYDWDDENPAEISRGAINNFTQMLVDGSYFDHAAQYGITSPSFTGSDEAIIPPPVIAGYTEFLSIATWMEAETAPLPIPFTGNTVGLLPEPTDDTIYAVYLSHDVEINDFGYNTCDDFGAYHFFGGTLVWVEEVVPYPPFVLVYPAPQTFAYAVLPTACGSGGTFDGVTSLATHELIEAATDPIILSGWIDNSQYEWLNANILKKGEAADICELGVGGASPAHTRMTDGLLVAAYWSNADGKCVPLTRTFHLAETGLPGTVPHEATFDGGTVALPFDTIVDDGSTHSYAFPSPVADPDPGIRYVTSEPPATFAVTANFSKTAVYTTQYWLDVQAVPPAAAVLDTSLTPSDWIDAGQTVTLTTDPIITVGPDSRYRFDRWSGDVSSTSPSQPIVMTAPTTAVANYALQYLVTVATSGLGNNVTHILNGGVVIGAANDANPLSVFVDAGPLALDADAFVYGAGAVQYFFQGFTPPAPATLGAPFSTTAVYATMAQLIQQALASGGIYGPGAAGLAKSLLMQWAAVEADLAAGNYAQALADLQSFISHIQAQAGVHVTPALSTELQLDALLVYHAGTCLALGAGQLDATGAAAAYAYYSGLVTMLGGIPLPPC